MTVIYQCQLCQKKTTIKEGKKAPICCGKPMTRLPLDICLQPDQAEHARPMVDQDACDDFRAGK